MSSSATWPLIESVRSDAGAAAFKRINEEWITRMFSPTDEDRKLLDDPVAHIVSPGGDVLVARIEDNAVVGCIALVPLRKPGVRAGEDGRDPASPGPGQPAEQSAPT